VSHGSVHSAAEGARLGPVGRGAEDGKGGDWMQDWALNGGLNLHSRARGTRVAHARHTGGTDRADKPHWGIERRFRILFRNRHSGLQREPARVRMGELGVAKATPSTTGPAAAAAAIDDRPSTPHVEPPALDGQARTILDVGRAHFVKFGFQKTSVAKIAEEAGTSVGLLYYHFKNKEGLYRALWNDYQHRQWQQAHDAIKLVRTAGVTDGRMLFLAGTRTYVSNCWENRDIVRLFYDQDAPPGFFADSRAAMREWLNMNSRLVTMGHDDGSSDATSTVLIEMASAAIAGATRSVAACATRHEADEVVNAAMAIFANMFEVERSDDTESVRRPVRRT
jgi:AcrR family transcriptional regulator